MLNFIILLFKNMENNKVFYEILKIKVNNDIEWNI